jgi:hypothetical protein
LDYDRALLDNAIDTTNPNGYFVRQVDIPGGGVAYDYPEWRQGWAGKKLFEAPRKTLPKMVSGQTVDDWQEEHDRPYGIPGFESAAMGAGGEVFPLYPADDMDLSFTGGQWEFSEDSLWEEFGSSAGELEGLPGNVEIAVDWATQNIADIDPWQPTIADESLWLAPPAPQYWAPPGDGMPEPDQMWQDAAHAYESVFFDVEADWYPPDGSGDWVAGEAVDWAGGDSAAGDQDPGEYYDEFAPAVTPTDDGTGYDIKPPAEFSGDAADQFGTFEEPTDYGPSSDIPGSTDEH